jgi:metal-responsive CopG/Arc/MetJ family transcriptional regulator
MLVKTSITLSKKILSQVDQYAEGASNRSSEIDESWKSSIGFQKN